MANHDQASVLVQLAQWGTALGLEDALPVLFSDDFDPDAATTDDAHVIRLLEFGELVGTLTKHGLLDADLALDAWWVSGAWARVAPAAMRDRERLGEPGLYENFEALAAQQSPS
jgi:hypothetical protein